MTSLVTEQVALAEAAVEPIRRRAPKKDAWYWVRLVAAIVISLVMFFPLYWMIVTAFSPQADMYGGGLNLWPKHFTWYNFSAPIARFPVWRWFWNSTLIASFVTVITVTCNLLAGYAFAKLRFRGKNPLFLVLLSTMMIPVQAVMVPLFKVSVKLNLFGNIWAVILPESAAIFGVFLARQFFIAIPTELLEAARVDGASQFRTFRSIVLPLCKPLVATLTLLTFSNEWNAFAWPLVALFNNEQLFTLPLGTVTDLQSEYGSNYGAIMAMSLIAIIPMVVLFVAFQKYFVQGLARSGIK